MSLLKISVQSNAFFMELANYLVINFIKKSVFFIFDAL